MLIGLVGRLCQVLPRSPGDDWIASQAAKISIRDQNTFGKEFEVHQFCRSNSDNMDFQRRVQSGGDRQCVGLIYCHMRPITNSKPAMTPVACTDVG